MNDRGNWRAFIEGAALFALLGGSGCDAKAPGHSTAPSRGAVVVPASHSSTPVPARSPAKLPDWKQGDLRTYRVRLRSEARVGGQPLTQFVFTAELTIVSLDVSAERVLLRASLTKPSFETTLDGKAREFLPIERELSLPYGFELGSGGQWVATSFSDEPSALAVGIREALAAALQAPTSNTGSSFTAQEFDPTGEYEVRYTKGADPRTWRKRKLSALPEEPSTSSATPSKGSRARARWARRATVPGRLRTIASRAGLSEH